MMQARGADDRCDRSSEMRQDYSCSIGMTYRTVSADCPPKYRRSKALADRVCGCDPDRPKREAAQEPNERCPCAEKSPAHVLARTSLAEKQPARRTVHRLQETGDAQTDKDGCHFSPLASQEGRDQNVGARDHEGDAGYHCDEGGENRPLK